MLKVNEIFPAVQGEGKSLGKDVVFLRTALCNLHCIWCDTPYTWNWEGTKFAHPDKYDYKTEVRPMDTESVVKAIQSYGTKAVVVSGGEPFLQQKDLIPVLELLARNGYWIEIETNGTVPPRPEFFQLLNQINCSPKLSNSGDPQNLRIRHKVLESLVATKKANFKFVISTQNDALEASELVRKYGMDEVYFMPEGRTKVEIETATSLVKLLAIQFKAVFTTRQHILIHGATRGV